MHLCTFAGWIILERGMARQAFLQACTCAQRHSRSGGIVKWVNCGNKYIVADVIRWRETIWKPRVTKRARPRKIGDRLLTAEVLRRDASGWVQLKVVRSETTPADDWLRPIRELEVNAVVRRQAGTIQRGRPSRLIWTEEGAREAVLGNPRPMGKFFKPG